MLTAMYQFQSPKTMPIKQEYHTSANPSFFFDRKKASRKTDRPNTAPAIDGQSEAYGTVLRMKNRRKAKMKANRGTVPVLISITAIAAENKMKRAFDIASMVMGVYYKK